VKRKIMIVDDEEKFCQMVKKNLEKTNQYEVQYETKGMKALETAKAFMPELMILDVMIPDRRGSDVLGDLKKDEVLKNVPVIFLTSLAKKGSKDLFLGLVDGRPFHANPAIPKPINTKDLVQCIEETLAAPKPPEVKP